MWKLVKPCIKKAIGKDVDELVSHCNHLDDDDKNKLIELYKNYDDQKGAVSDEQLKIISEIKAKAIHEQYNKTYSGKILNYIRTELNSVVELCPNCSIGEVSHLDHFMPRSKFKALSVCRLNLIPTCSICNSKKGDDDYKKYIHPYYEEFPEAPFLIADVTASSLKLIVNFRLDSTVIENSTLEDKLKYQTEKIELWNRLSKSSNSFVHALLDSCCATDLKQLKTWLNDRLNKSQDSRGLNDWQTAIIRGIIDCPQLSMEIIDSYRNTPNRVNNGAGA